MNHGYCINCWWYKPIKGRRYIMTNSGLVEELGNGRCYMHSGDEDNFSLVEGSSYCPDYINRKRGDMVQKTTIDEWLVNA